jgi:hypothetical protein
MELRPDKVKIIEEKKKLDEEKFKSFGVEILTQMKDAFHDLLKFNSVEELTSTGRFSNDKHNFNIIEIHYLINTLVQVIDKELESRQQKE